MNLRLPDYQIFKSPSFKVFAEGLWHNNPIFVMVLGICSSLAVTTMAKNAFVMWLGVTVVMVISSATISWLRFQIPQAYRMMAYMLLISTPVIVLDQILRITLPAVSKEMGPYVGLIITNCIVMGRAEAFAMSNPPGHSALDAAGAGCGYGMVLVVIGFVRELFGAGSLFGFRILPAAYPSCGLLMSAPGAFLALATLILLANTIRERYQDKKK